MEVYEAVIAELDVRAAARKAAGHAQTQQALLAQLMATRGR